jgi:hypothetical protein
VLRIEHPAIWIVRWDDDIIRARDVLEILEPPGIAFENGHGRKLPRRNGQAMAAEALLLDFPGDVHID